MAAVTSRAQRIGHPVAIVAIIMTTLIFLAPIYWIASTAFKPRAVATSVPPTVMFTPEITPFVKLFTKRVQLREQPTPEAYEAAPWWEQSIFDGGERVLEEYRYVICVSSERRRRFTEDAMGGFHGPIPLKGIHSGEHFIEHDSERENV